MPRCKISREGFLFIERGGRMRATACPFTPPITVPVPQRGLQIPGGGPGIMRLQCGDQCPLFGEPEEHGRGKYKIPLCHTIILNVELVDERDAEPKGESNIREIN